jgi:hypothetical protein
VSSRWRRWWKGYFAFTGLTTGLLLAALGSATCRPDWYQPVNVDYSRLAADKRELVGLLDEIGAALNANRPIEVVLREEQINRWIAARDELWPGLQVELVGLAFPQVNLLENNRIRVAATARNGPVSVILSAVGRCELTDDQVRVRIERVSSGRLPILRDPVLEPLRRAIAESGGPRVSMDGDTITISNAWRWRNGERRFRVADFETARGMVRLRLEPLPGFP